MPSRSAPPSDRSWLTSLLLPAILALLPVLRSYRGRAFFSPPFLLLTGGLLLLQRMLTRTSRR